MATESGDAHTTPAEGQNGAVDGSSKRIFAPAPTSSGQAAQFQHGTLHRSALAADPLAQFHTWFAAASAASVPVPETCCLATASLPSGMPSARFVYLKELDDQGFIIYSNWGTSRKAADIATNPQASLVFWWRELERQVRVEGRIERLTTDESFAYYRLRARGSKIGAWASRQSQVLKSGSGHETKSKTDGSEDGDGNEDDGRGQLDQWVAAEEERFKDTADGEIPCPPFWGGARVVPMLIEFWQGRDSRLHDRFVYRRAKEGETWVMERLSP